MRKKRSRFGAPVVVQPAVAATTSETSASSQPRKRSRFGVAVDPAIAAAAAASAAAAIEATKEKQRKIAARKAKLARWKAQQAAAPAATAPAPATEDPSSSLPLAPVTARFDIDIKRRRRPQGALAQPSSSASLVGVFDAAPSVPKAAPGEFLYIFSMTQNSINVMLYLMIISAGAAFEPTAADGDGGAAVAVVGGVDPLEAFMASLAQEHGAEVVQSDSMATARPAAASISAAATTTASGAATASASAGAPAAAAAAAASAAASSSSMSISLDDILSGNAAQKVEKVRV